MFMAESYLVRRGAGGGGSFGSLNVWTGNSPPSDKVGVFCQTNGTVDNIVINAEPLVYGENQWELYSGYVSNQNTAWAGCLDSSGNVYTLYSNYTLYRADPKSGTYTSLKSPGQFNNNGYSIFEYDSLIMKIGGWYSTGTIETSWYDYIDAYNVESNTWTLQYKKVNIPRTQTRFKSFASVYGGNDIVIMDCATTYTDPSSYCYAYNIQTETITNISTLSFHDDTTAYSRFICKYGNYVCYIVYCSPTNSSTVKGFKVDTTTLSVSDWTSSNTSDRMSNFIQMNTGMSVNGHDYILQGSNSVYELGDNLDYNTKTLWGYMSSQPSPFYPTMIGTHGTKAYGIYNNNKLCSFGQASPLEANTLLIMVGDSTYKGEIVSGDSYIEIPITESYYYDGNTLTKLTTQTRITGEEWKTVV